MAVSPIFTRAAVAVVAPVPPFARGTAFDSISGSIAVTGLVISSHPSKPVAVPVTPPDKAIV